MLGLDEATFWRCTFRKLDALMKVHNEVQTGEKDKVQEEPLTLTELLSWGG